MYVCMYVCMYANLKKAEKDNEFSSEALDEIDNEEEEEGRGKRGGKEDGAEAAGDGKHSGGSKFDYETLTDANGHVWSGVIIDQDVVSHTLPRERLVNDTRAVYV